MLSSSLGPVLLRGAHTGPDFPCPKNQHELIEPCVRAKKSEMHLTLTGGGSNQGWKSGESKCLFNQSDRGMRPPV
jgi:hypothetical protein